MPLKKLTKGKNHLVIPDGHAKPDTDMKRFEALGNFIADTLPDVIVNIGDLADMASLCSYEYGKRQSENRRYKDDIEAAILANKLIFGPLAKVKEQMPKYRPKTIMCIGNHEQRIQTAIDNDAKMEGVYSLDDLQYGKFYQKVIPFLKVHVEDGVAYSHYFVSGVMGRPIGGVHIANSMINKLHCSATMGHTHLMGYAEQTDGTGKRVIGHVAGCFFDDDHDYAGPANAMYNRGITLKHNVVNGVYDIERVSIDRLIQNYL